MTTRILAAIVTALSVAATGCLHGGNGVDENSPEVVVLAFLDVSKSTYGDRGVQRQRYLDAFERIVHALPGGTLLKADLIDSNPLASSSLPISEFFKKQGGLLSEDNEREVRAQNEAAADRAIREFASFLDRRPRGDSILDSLNIAQNVFGSYPTATTRYLVIFSDMIESSRRYPFTRASLTPQAAKAFIRRERDDGTLPELPEVDVYVIGAGATRGADASPDHIRRVRQFWLTYMDAVGAVMEEHRYGPTLIRFP
jgi:hypothetical protein